MCVLVPHETKRFRYDLIKTASLLAHAYYKRDLRVSDPMWIDHLRQRCFTRTLDSCTRQPTHQCLDHCRIDLFIFIACLLLLARLQGDRC